MILTEYPQFRTSKDIDTRFAPIVGGITNTSYETIRSIFGKPTFSVENGDGVELDTTSKCVWKIQFADGTVVKISDKREFGSYDHVYKITDWTINSNNDKGWQLIKALIDLHTKKR